MQALEPQEPQRVRGANPTNLPTSAATVVSNRHRPKWMRWLISVRGETNRDNAVLERDQKLSELDDRADALQAGASQFESSAAKLKNKYWWKNIKMMIMMGIIGVILVGIVFMYFYY
ncbi:synaptobrevin-like [Cyprinus carpio]|uniref:Synaptobrevin-like n=1 Tax=Cyprinus carpio TaxID=7962 RepID=A0A9Q9VAC1_CYPCA|nr:synaptobrevin-like [Cyprinus carpio]